MRLSTALAPFLCLVLGVAPAPHIHTSAAPVAAPAAAPPAANPAPPAANPAAANLAGVVPLPEDEALDPNEVVHKATTTDTKNNYRDICTDFCVYLYDSGDEFVLAAPARTAFNDIDAQHDDTTPKGKKQRTEAMRAKVKEWLIVDEKMEAGSRQQHKLIDFRRYKPEVVVKYLCSRKQIKKNPTTGQMEERLLGNSRYSAIRTALMTYLAEVYDHEWTSKQLAYMKKALKGISKETSTKTQKKGRANDMEPGKKAMSFELYEKTNEWLIEQGDRSAVYARAFLAKTWSLACRSDSTQSIKTADLVWRDDASGIVFAHQKNDQDGSRARKPRHSYLNPINWWNLLEHWFVGSEILQVPPLEMLDIDDVRWQIRGDKNLRDARALVKAVVAEAKRKNIWGDGDHTATELRQIYRQCREDVGITGNVTNSWKTALRKVREKKRREEGGAVTSRPSTGRKRNRTVDNTGRVDCNPHHRMRLTRTHGERTLAAGLNAAAPPVATEQVTMRQAQGQSFVDSVVGVENV